VPKENVVDGPFVDISVEDRRAAAPLERKRRRRRRSPYATPEWMASARSVPMSVIDLRLQIRDALEK